MRRRVLLAITVTMVIGGLWASSALATWPGKNGQIVFTGKGGKVMAMNANGTRKHVISGKLYAAEAPAVSSDGQWIVFDAVATPSSPHFQLYKVMVNGTHLTRLTHTSVGEWCGSFSPSGKKIVWSEDDSYIWIMNSNGTRPHALGSTSAAECPKYSPSGKKIAYDDRSNIWVMNSNGTGQVNLTSGAGTYNRYADWSPNGKQIAFISNRSGANEVWVMNANGTNPVQLNSGANASDTPAWSPDGKYIVYATGTGSIVRQKLGGGSATIGTASPAYGLAWLPLP